MSDTIVNGQYTRAAYNEVDAEATYPEVKQVNLSQLEATAEASKIKLRKMKFQLKDDIGKYVAQARVLTKRQLIPVEHPNVVEEESKQRLEQHAVQEIVMEQIQTRLSKLALMHEG